MTGRAYRLLAILLALGIAYAGAFLVLIRWTFVETVGGPPCLYSLNLSVPQQCAARTVFWPLCTVCEIALPAAFVDMSGHETCWSGGVELVFYLLKKRVGFRVFVFLVASVPVATAIVALIKRRYRRRDGAETCVTCGYDLTGNVSGVCPECGCVVRPRAGAQVQPGQVPNVDGPADK